jgi:hypothetical protein
MQQIELGAADHPPRPLIPNWKSSCDLSAIKKNF